MKTGLFGGTFDPPHLAHVAIAEAALSFAGLDRVIWIPAANPPHRNTPDSAAEHRLRMVELVVAEYDRFEASGIELNREGPSFTVETIRQLRPILDDDELSLIIGGDSLRSFSSWREPETILESVNLIVFGRDSDPYDEVSESVMASTLVIPATPVIDISSTDIRRRVKEGRSIDDLVPKVVGEYIRARELYRELGIGD